jgi:hypothetical protein
MALIIAFVVSMALFFFGIIAEACRDQGFLKTAHFFEFISIFTVMFITYIALRSWGL